MHAHLAMARRLGHVHNWWVAVTPPRYVIYLVNNIWLQTVYIGVTTAALAGCIPMGGSFSAQSANLQCQWEVYQHRHLRNWETYIISATRFVYWGTEWGKLGLCQFRDNILLATSLEDDPQVAVVQNVCTILQTVWKLRVLCPCDGIYTHACLKPNTTDMVI